MFPIFFCYPFTGLKCMGSMSHQATQLGKYTVVHGEFESDLQNTRILRPDEKIDVNIKKQNRTNIGISLGDRS